jgi:hypothetical protein
MLVNAHLLCRRFILLSILSLSLFTARLGRGSGLITRRLFLLLIRLGLLRAWFDRGLYRSRLRLSFWLFLDAGRAARGYIGVGSGGSGFRFSNHDYRR